MTKTIIALGPLLPAEMERLETHFTVVKLWQEKDMEQALKDYKDKAQALLSKYNTPVSARLIEALPNLEIISQFGVGVDNIDLDAAFGRDITVTNTPDVLTDDTADIALSLILSLSRRIVEGDMYVRVGKWANGPMPLGRSLSNKKVGIVGLGRIGKATAKRCLSFNMSILYNGPNKKGEVNYQYYDDLGAMAEACDYLVLACCGGEETKNLVNRDVLKKLGPSGALINIARGSVINEEDLLVALKNKEILGAGLDVYKNEPRVPEALFSMDNVVLLPHIGSATQETRAIMGDIVINNLLAHFEGNPLLTPIHKEV